MIRRFTLSSIVAMTALAGVAALAQAPATIATMADHVALMKSNGQAVGTLNKALGSGAYADARTANTTLRTNFTTLRTFWASKNNTEVLAVINDGLSRLEALDKMLSASTPDQMAAQAAAKEFAGNACGACHKMQREGDAQTGFRFRQGTSPF